MKIRQHFHPLRPSQRFIMLRIVGKGMQIAALIVLPLAMLMQLMAGIRAPTGNGITVSAMLIMFIGGFAMFYLGRMLEGIGQR